MLSLLAPILAQLVTLNVGDRTEARYISGDDTHLEGATRPFAGLNFGWKRSALTLAYTPSVTVTPLERKPRNVLVFQGASLRASYRWRLTTLTLSEFVGFGELNFRVQALPAPGVNLAVAPPATGATPPVTGQAPM